MIRKSVLIALAMALMALFAAAPCSAAETLLQNGGFEDSAGGIPRGWSVGSWKTGEDAGRFTVDSANAHGGRASVSIENVKPNDSRLMQTVEVRPDTIYRLSGWIRAVRIGTSAKGANLSVAGLLETTEEVFDTDGQWIRVDLYGKTGSKQSQIQVTAGIGGYGGPNIGQAGFDDIELTEAVSVPAEVRVISLDPNASAGGESKTQSNGPPSVSVFPILLIAAAFTAVFLYVRFRIARPERPGLTAGRYGVWLAGGLAAAFIFRVILALNDHGHPIDMGTFTAWALRAADMGLGGFYGGGVFADYPPGYIYVLYAVGTISKLLGLGHSDAGMRLLIKLPAILADMASAYLIFRFGRETAGARTAAAMALLFAFNPAIWIDSAAWGQVDSVYALTMAASLLELSRGKWYRSGIWYALTVLIKPQALIIGPVVALALLDRAGWKKAVAAVLAGAAAFVLLLIPFSVRQHPLWIVDLYKTTLASYPYASLNGFNLHALAGGNWARVQDKLLIFSYQTWGTVLMAAAFAMSVWLYISHWRKRDGNSPESGPAFLLACLLIAAVFVLGPKMHERYMYPTLLLSLFAFLRWRDRRLLILFFGLSVTQYINIGYVYEFALRSVYQIPKWDFTMIAVSLANVILLGYLACTAYDLLVRRHRLAMKDGKDDPNHTSPGARIPAPSLAEPKPGPEPEPPSRFTRKEALLLGGLTLLYAAIALFRLGSLSAPQTFWQPAKAGDGFTVEFAEVRQLSQLNSFGGAGEIRFTVEFSTDGGNWSNPVAVDQNYTKNFTWTVTPLQVTARYARVTADRAGPVLNEMAFYGPGSDSPVPVRASVGNGAKVFDEQKEAVYHPGYLNGAYFDEIYFARTAFEHLHGIAPYETTHPPLGKLIIAAGIFLFGMDPFGWRIAGTLLGIAMIPMLYLFARSLFGRKEYAFGAAFLLAFDLMHFTQTRIATIDVFGVFFIMLMYYFMYRYYRLNFYRVPLKRTLVPLFWSGLFFGLGAASKWIAIYGGAGLALIFFLSLYERYREYASAQIRLKNALRGSKRKPAPDASSDRLISDQFARLSSKTVAWCALFFVIVPAAVYAVSFVPALAANGGTFNFQRLLQFQVSMYDYQSQLKATHPFSSNWYQWPFITRPLWYYSGQYAPAGLTSTIAAMGNPAVWWPGIAAVIASVWLVRKMRDRGMLVVLAAFFSQYLPWIFVSRLTFIYHYFAMVPFMILCLVYVIQYGVERRNWNKRLVYAYFAAVFLLFLLFYPAASGMEVSREYVDHFLRWFPAWDF